MAQSDFLMDPIHLEPSSGLTTTPDLRPRMDVPPPVRLIAVENIRRDTLPNLAKPLEDFYVGLWQFIKESEHTFKAENFRLNFDVVEHQNPIERDSVRPQGIIIKSLRDAEKKLIDAEIEYERQRGLIPGHYSLLCKDPAGNWIELFETVELG